MKDGAAQHCARSRASHAGVACRIC